MNDAELDSIRADLAAATQGPWFLQPNDLIGGWCVRSVDVPPSQGPNGDVADFIREEDARLIARAPTIIASLLGEVERLRTLSARYDKLARCMDCSVEEVAVRIQQHAPWSGREECSTPGHEQKRCPADGIGCGREECQDGRCETLEWRRARRGEEK